MVSHGDLTIEDAASPDGGSSHLEWDLSVPGGILSLKVDQIEQMIGQDHVVHWELKRGERAAIERLISISCYRGICHQDGSPLRSQRTHTNARTCHKQIWK
uniref:Small ribosomal subunit protein uS13m n=1 Tax=Lactuca sativa TaxID=4236 RepID=A0A9R1VY77_LACSA|nr:hypothetical protein LSAT_V11C400214690 [Lactuca sativa]